MTILNAVLCALICLRLLAYRRAGARHKPFASALAYVLILATAWVVIRTVFGRPPAAGIETVAINTVFCIATWAVRGNVCDLFRAPVPWSGVERRKGGSYAHH